MQGRQKKDGIYAEFVNETCTEAGWAHFYEWSNFKDAFNHSDLTNLEYVFGIEVRMAFSQESVNGNLFIKALIWSVQKQADDMTFYIYDCSNM